jgi:hypothetical protein
MAKGKKQESEKTLRESLDAITFKNEQAQRIKSIQEGKERLKDRMAKNRDRRVSAASRISGLQTLNSSLGNQFKK